jgi:hypothetical protein
MLLKPFLTSISFGLMSLIIASPICIWTKYQLHDAAFFLALMPTIGHDCYKAWTRFIEHFKWALNRVTDLLSRGYDTSFWGLKWRMTEPAA